VFLDMKLHDIPNTVAGAVAAVRELGVDYVTAHAGGGAEMLSAACREGDDQVGILAVTLLTHMSADSLSSLGIEGPPERVVSAWAEIAVSAGCVGAVCSPREVARLRASLPRSFVLVTPGVRPTGAAPDDQRRTATPSEALAAGADILVVGRPLTRAADPEAALESVLAGMSASAQ
jgi:orotidine-5'-phosphate decarboxylase